MKRKFAAFTLAPLSLLGACNAIIGNDQVSLFDGSGGVGDASVRDASTANDTGSVPGTDAPAGTADSTPDTAADTSSSGPGPDSSIPESGSGSDAPVSGNDSGSCTPVTSGLIGHYVFGAGSINGSTATDSSGNGNTGTLHGFSGSEPQSAPAPFDEALVFPKSTEADVEVSNLPLNTAAGGMNSVSMWFYRNGPTSNVSDVLVSVATSPVYDLWLTYGLTSAGSDIYLCLNTGNSDCFGVASTTLLGRWVHVVGVFANGSTSGGTLYVDGQKQTSSCMTGNGFLSCTGAAGTAAAPLEFGLGNGFYFNGTMYDARVYNRALTATEVTELYNGTACP
jgi:MSHA biogenesis protein MshQ